MADIPQVLHGDIMIYDEECFMQGVVVGRSMRGLFDIPQVQGVNLGNCFVLESDIIPITFMHETIEYSSFKIESDIIFVNFSEVS